VQASLPYDYAASFPITGQPGSVHESVINISPEGPFTACGVSYGFEQDRGQPIGSFLPQGQQILPGQLKLGDFPIDVLMDGLRVGPRYLPMVLETTATADGLEFTGRFAQTQLLSDVLNSSPVFEQVQPPANFEFFFTIIDSASGRELQDQPAFNVAALGESHGRRPFRYFPCPVRFGARCSIRMQIVERTANVQGTLFIDLFGVQKSGACAAPVYEPRAADSRVIPFDQVARLSLTGMKGNHLEDDVPINAEGGFFVTSIGYGLQTDEPEVDIALPQGPPATIDLTKVTLSRLPPNALIEGFRLAPGFLRLALDPAGGLNTALPSGLAGRVLESLNRPEDVSFRYSLFDSGSGRELQNQFIHNVAGLGSAKGERPFKKLMLPLHLAPRSTCRVAVDEHFGRGELYIVLQGYKLLEAAAAGGRS
jgi:hypothetical protein